MKRHLLACAAFSLTVLTGCDQVKVPGLNPAGETSATEDVGDALAEAQAAAAETEKTDNAIVVSDPPPASETPTVTETIDREPLTDNEAEPSLADTADTDAETPEGEVSVQSIVGRDGDDVDETEPLPSLAALNATVCGLIPDSPPTPTVASVAGATHLEEQAVGTAAVNGLSATLASFPGIVKIEPRAHMSAGTVTMNHCSATRIAAHWFVTAAHCVDDEFEEIRLIGESENLRSPLAKITTAAVAVCHGGYKGTVNGYANDLALVRLTDEQVAAIGNVPIARFGATVKPLAPANYQTADMAGWGLTHFGGQLSNNLLSANLSITGAGPAVIYVASRNGAGPCVGDSGGPLYVTEEDGSRTIVGVLSVVEQNRLTGEFCAGEYNGRYTNLQGYADWIETVMARCEADPESCR